MISMLTRRPPRPAAWLLVGVVVAVSACGSVADAGSDDDTTATRAPKTSSRPEALPIRDDLVNPQVVPWLTWRAVDNRTLEVTVSAGPIDCYGANPEVAESESAVGVRVRVGRLPQAAEKECPAIALESAVLVRLATPLGARKVEHLT